MAKADVFVKRILGLINARGSEAPIEADEAQDTIFWMNSYMADQAASGIALGYTEIEGLGDTVTIPAGANLGMIANVAVVMANEFGIVVTLSLAKMAVDGLKTMRKLGTNVGTSILPSTLPRGHGNEGHFGRDDHFFPADASLIEKEDGGFIALETNQ